MNNLEKQLKFIENEITEGRFHYTWLSQLLESTRLLIKQRDTEVNLHFGGVVSEKLLSEYKEVYDDEILQVFNEDTED